MGSIKLPVCTREETTPHIREKKNSQTSLDVSFPFLSLSLIPSSPLCPYLFPFLPLPFPFFSPLKSISRFLDTSVYLRASAVLYREIYPFAEKNLAA